MSVYLHTFIIWLIFVAFVQLFEAVNFWSLIGLTPPAGLVFQGTLFMVFYLLMKQFLFDPMQVVFRLRETETEGKQRDSADAKQKTAEMLAFYEARLETAKLEAVKSREALAIDGENQEKHLVTASRDKARKLLDKMQQELVSDSEEAQQQLHREVNDISSRIVSQLNLGAQAGAPKKKIVNS